MSYFSRPASNNSSMASMGLKNSYSPNINTVRPRNNKYCRPTSGYNNRSNGNGDGNIGRNNGNMPGFGTSYVRQPYGMAQPTESRWSFAGGLPNSDIFQKQPMNGTGNYATKPKMMVGRSRAPSVASFHPVPSFTNIQKPPMMQMQMPATTAATTMQSSKMTGSSGGNNGSAEQDLPTEGENCKYVRLNWEDILGGKDGLGGLRVSMAPATADNPNRQIHIGMGAPGKDGQPSAENDGSVPLKIVKFEPVENYPGQMTGSSTSVNSAPSPSPPAAPQSNNNYRQQQASSNGGGNYGNAGPAAVPSLQMYQGQQVINLPKGYSIAPGFDVSSALQGVGSVGGNNGNNMKMVQTPQGPMMMMVGGNPGQQQQQGGGGQQGQGRPCPCAACQFKQPTSAARRR